MDEKKKIKEAKEDAVASKCARWFKLRKLNKEAVEGIRKRKAEMKELLKNPKVANGVGELKRIAATGESSSGEEEEEAVGQVKIPGPVAKKRKAVDSAN